jgi:hypothetical protein
VIEIDGQFPILNCKRCGVSLFYQSPKEKHGIVASKYALIFASEEYFQAQKSILSTNLKEEFNEEQEESEDG